MSKTVALLAFALILAPAGVSAQVDFPNRPVRMIAAAASTGRTKPAMTFEKHLIFGTFRTSVNIWAVKICGA